MYGLIGNVFILIGIILIIFGLIGLYRYKHFHQRILIASVIDTAGFISVVLGIVINNGLSFFSLKVILILLLMLILNPIASHIMIRGAYASGYKMEEENRG